MTLAARLGFHKDEILVCIETLTSDYTNEAAITAYLAAHKVYSIIIYSAGQARLSRPYVAAIGFKDTVFYEILPLTAHIYELKNPGKCWPGIVTTVMLSQSAYNKTLVKNGGFITIESGPYCLHCEDQFEPTPETLDGYCSDSCREIGLEERNTRYCSNCTEPYIQNLETPTNYCSESCKEKHELHLSLCVECRDLREQEYDIQHSVNCKCFMCK